MSLAPFDAALLALALVGVVDALYFVLVSAGRIEPDSRWIPRACRMDRATCGAVLETPYARLFGVPNSTWGLVWYALLIAALVADVTGAFPVHCAALLFPATVVATYSVYLAAVLKWRLRTFCALCYLAHVTNVAILGLVSLRCATGSA